jgi:hypothetical protein
VIKHDKDNDIYFINASWGWRSDWFRNLIANPNVQVHIARKKFNGKATVLPLKAGNLLMEFISQHTNYVCLMIKLISVKIRFNEEEIRSLISEMPIVAIRPQKA